jgi:proline iminopeptidase
MPDQMTLETSRRRWWQLGQWISVLAVTSGLGGVACGVHTRPFTDGRGRVVPGSVAEMTDHVIGGVPQRLWFRGLDVERPAVILLHGGPGASEAALFRRFNRDLERHFLVIYWEQRGAGRSFSKDIPPASMTIAQFVRDLDEVVELARRRFQRDRVVLLGHSWGTAIGILYAAQFPEKVAAYLGIGQVADMPKGERVSWEFARREAARRRDRGALRDLERIGPPPHTVDDMLTSRKQVERFDGTFHGPLSTGRLIWAAFRTDEASLVDLIKFGQGNRFSLEHLWNEFRTFDIDDTLLSFDVPIAFLLGRHDWVVPSVLADRYLQRITAPCTQLVWFEQSAHNPPFEEPEAFNRAVIDTVASFAIRCPGVTHARREQSSLDGRSSR